MNKIKNYRWHMIALVCFITVINYLDRTALGIAAPTIMETTGITKEQYSWIVSAFQLAYTLGQPVMGFFIDTVGLKLSFAICAAIWGLATMGHALTSGGLQRSDGNSGGCKNRINMVPGKRAWRGDRCFQYGHLTRRDACSTVDCLVHYVS